MNSKGRVMMAVDHKEPDRVPMSYDLWPMPKVSEKVYKYLGVDNHEDMLIRLHSDLRKVDPIYIGPELRTYPDGSADDIWSIRGLSILSESGSSVPLKDVTTIAEVEAHPWPDPDWFDYSQLADDCEKYKDYAVVGGGWSPIFCIASALQGMETFMINMIINPPVAEAIVEKITDFYWEMSRMIFEAVKGGIDFFYLGDDYGMQTGLLMSVEMWRKYFKPPLKRLFDLGKSYDLKILMHSCGSIRKIIPDLVDIGLDVLDPIQVKATGMDPVELKKEFGAHISFHGSIDTQWTLPYGTAGDVRNEVKERIETIGVGGGFILSASQSFLPEVPVENIVEMFEAGWELGRY